MDQNTGTTHASDASVTFPFCRGCPGKLQAVRQRRFRRSAWALIATIGADSASILRAVAAERRRMPWMAVEKAYEFEGPQGKVSLLELFEGRRQFIVYRAVPQPHRPQSSSHQKPRATPNRSHRVADGVLPSRPAAVWRSTERGSPQCPCSRARGARPLPGLPERRTRERHDPAPTAGQ